MLAFLASAWAAIKGSKVAEYCLAGIAVFGAAFAAFLEVFERGKADGTETATSETLTANATATEKANAASAAARADGALDRLQRGSF